MSTTAIAYSVIGIKGSDIYQTQRHKAFEHSYPEAYQFDPLTKKELWIEYPTCIFNGKEEPGKITTSSGLNLETVCIHWTKSKLEAPHFLGLVQEDYLSDDPKMLSISGELIKQVKQDLKTFLKPYKLWKEKNFGLWTLQYLS